MRPPKCLCSKCEFFLRGQKAEDLDDYMDHLDGAVRLNYFEQREYQTALIEIATKRNIIACLPTGSGKTFIAYKLIEHFQHDIASKGKKVFFLANTIPLVNQQAAFFARNLTLKVKHITGDMEVDYWSPEKWDVILNDCQILAMTAQIFLNIVRHAYIKFSQIALIVLDECHHAHNDHPMKQIMLEYNTTKKNYPEYDMPRVLGLTATIIMGNCKTSEVPSRIKELENTMSSIAVTYKDYEEVMRHSTSAVLQPVRIEKAISYTYTSFTSTLGMYATELQVLRKERKKLKANVLSIQGIDPTLKATSNIYLCNRKPGPGDLRIAVDDIRRTFEDMGEYCTVIAINLRLAFIEFSLLDVTDDVMKTWYNKIRTVFIEFKQSIIARMERCSDENKVIQFITPKLSKLIDIIEQNFQASADSSNACECGDNDNQLCGLIFTDRRVTAQVLAWYLKDLAAMNTRYPFIKANFVVGTSRCPFETVESRIYAKKQTATINGLVILTAAAASDLLIWNIQNNPSVLEEGIDVPSCNLVVRFDKIQTYTSYVQSMGRARKKNALFYAFLDSEFYARDEPKLRNFKDINEAMVSYLRAQVLKIDEETDRKFDHASEHSIEPFCPGGTADSPRVTMESAQEIIENYCALLPNDGISSLQTISWWTEHGLSFKGHLKLPMNSALKGVVEGLIMKDKLLAKQSVHFEAVKKLHELDALDERLCPQRSTVPLKVEAFFTKLTPFTATGDEKDVNTTGAGLEDGEIPEVDAGDVDTDAAFLARLFRKDWFRKKGPEIFQRCQLVIGERYTIYRFCIELTEPNPKNKWQELYKLESSKTAFGIISAEDIPDIGKFPLFGIFGTLSVTLEKIPDFSLNLRAENFRILRDFQQIIFHDVLDLQHPLLEAEKELSYAIIPLEKGDEGWRVYSKLFPRRDEDPGINSIFTISRTRVPHDEIRKNSARGSRFEQDRSRTYVRKFTDTVVYPWYKGKSGPIYVVDTVELEMSPRSRFHDGFYSDYKDFIKTQYKKEVYNNEQPLLKCKLAGIGKGMKQLNYLLEKPTKEEEFPVYLVPELCFVLPIPASILVQVKLLPSILHRFFRLLIAKEILDSVGESCQWDGLLRNSDSTKFDPENIEIYTSAQDQDKAKEEERRKMREEARTRLKRPHKEIDKKKKIEDRELHYEFIHPNKITQKDIELFHEAVSGQHSAKKLILANNVEAELANEELYTPSKIELIDFDEVLLPLLDPALDLEVNTGPSLLCLLEAITRNYSNEGISFERLKIIGWSFLSYSISVQTFHHFPNWVEPLMCQLRNRLLSVQVLSTVAGKKNLGEILSGSGFYPNAVWLPPGFQLLPNVAEIAASNRIHLGVFNDVLRHVKFMTKEELENHVTEKTPIVLEADLREKATKIAKANGLGPEFKPGQKKKPPPQPSIKFATYTHTELYNSVLSDGLCALVGAFFTQCGSKGALKLSEWFGFTVPDLDGNEHFLGSWDALTANHSMITLEEAEKLIPNLNQLETLIGYKFNNRKFLLESLTHPTYFANNVSDCYQRLEFLGDAILDCLLTTHIFTVSTKHDLQKLTEIRAALVNSVTYASLAVRYDLHKYLLSMSKPLVDMIDNFVIYQEAAEHRVIGHFTLISDEECWGPKHIEVPKVLGDIFEALAGAIYLDSGLSLDAVWKVFYRLMQNEIDDFFEDVPKAPVRELKAAFPNPDQIIFKSWTSQKLRARGREMYKIDVGHLGHYFGSGTNKTRAKDAAAKLALKMLKEDDDAMAKFDGKKIMMMC